MNTEVSSLADTITPKSDQLNADDLLTGPITVTVKNVKRGDAEQPISVEIDGDRQPYKPCKSMRRVLIAVWGDDGRKWAGNRMTLYCDPEVKFGGVKVGGIRISHVSGIEAPMGIMLTTTRSKRSEFTVRPLTLVVDAACLQRIEAAPTLDALKEIYGTAYRNAQRAGESTEKLQQAYQDRKAVLEKPAVPGAVPFLDIHKKLNEATTLDQLDAEADLIQHVDDRSRIEELNGIYKARRDELLGK